MALIKVLIRRLIQREKKLLNASYQWIIDKTSRSENFNQQEVDEPEQETISFSDQLLQTVKDGDIKKVESLLPKIADVNVKNNLQETPLYLAVRSNTEMVRLLLDRGADVNSKAEFSWETKTLLHSAAEQGHLDVVNLLIQNNANVNIKNSDEMTLLHSAAQGGCKKTMELFLHKKEWINAKDKHGRTPLWLSVINNHIETAQLLIKHGADVNSLSSNSKKPLLCHAIEWSSSEMVELLIQKGADINAQGQYDKTPLQCAIEKYNEKELFQCLLYGANVNAEDRNTINNKPKFASCLAEFEKIKVKPQSGTLIEACRNRNKDIILDEKALAKEIQEIKEHYSSDKQLSFIPKCLDNFINHFTLKSVKEKCAQSFLAFPPESSLADTSKIVGNIDASASKSR